MQIIIIITDNTVAYEKGGDNTLESIGVNIGDVFNVLGTVSGGWWIKVGRNKVPVTKAEAKVYATASNHEAGADDSEGGCR